MFLKYIRGAVAKSGEHPSKVSVWCTSIDMGLNRPAAYGCRQNNPSSAICRGKH